MDRKEWLASLKVGDEVFLDSAIDPRIDYVTSVYNNGVRIGGLAFNCEGRVIGGLLTIFPVTEEHRKTHGRAPLLSRIRCANMGALTDSQLARIVAILDEGK